MVKTHGAIAQPAAVATVREAARALDAGDGDGYLSHFEPAPRAG